MRNLIGYSLSESVPPSKFFAQCGPWDWGFHTVRGDIDTVGLDFRPRGVEVEYIYIWKDV